MRLPSHALGFCRLLMANYKLLLRRRRAFALGPFSLPRRVRWGAIALALLCSVCFVRPAAAQGAPVVDPRKDAKMRFGPFYVTPSVQLREIGLDTNVFDTPVSPRSDFTATLAPKADVWVPFANRALITTSSAVAFVYYHTYPKARSIDPDVLIRGDVYVRRATFYAEDRYFKTRDRSLEVDASLARRTENAATGGTTVRFGSRFSADVAGYDRTLQY